METSNTLNYKNEIIVVSGLPRSGTSMMMQMLSAGGLDILTDGQRTADEDNPKGYYELERVKDLQKNDVVWLQDAQGKVVKIISSLLKHLPENYHFRVIFMERDVDEVIASQHQMILHRGEQANPEMNAKIRLLYLRHLKDIRIWLNEKSNFSAFYISYKDVLNKPIESASLICRFLGFSLDEKKMVGVVDNRLYRQRNP